MHQFSKMILLIPIVFFMFTQTSEAQRVKLEVRMGGKDAVQAKARFEQRGKRMKFNFQMGDAHPNSIYGVRVMRSGRVIDKGVVMTDQFGVANIDIDTHEGDQVPSLHKGDVIQVWFKGRRILAGALQ